MSALGQPGLGNPLLERVELPTEPSPRPGTGPDGAPPYDVHGDRERLERMRQEGYDNARQRYERDLGTAGDEAARADAERRYREDLRTVDNDVLTKSRQPAATAGRRDVLQDVSAASGTTIGQKPGAGRPESSGRGILGDVDAEVGSQAEANRVRKEFEKRGYKVNVQGDVMSVPELDVNVFTKPSGTDRVGGSAWEASLGRGGNREINLNQLPPGKEFIQDNPLNQTVGEIQKAKIFGPPLVTDGEVEAAAKATYKNMLNNRMADPSDPLFQKVSTLYNGSAKPESAGIVRPGATPEERAQDLAAFQEQIQRANLEAARNAAHDARDQHNKLWDDAAGAQDAYDRARASGDPDAVAKARDDLIRTKSDALEYDARQKQAMLNLEANNPEAAQRMTPAAEKLPGWSAESRYGAAIEGTERAMQVAGPAMLVVDFGTRLNNASYETLPDGTVRMRPKEERDRLMAINAAGMAGGTIAGAGTGALGATGFGIIGAAIGSIVPGVGTALGGAAGSLLGGLYTGIRGYMVGSGVSEKIAGSVYDSVHAPGPGHGRNAEGLSPRGVSALNAMRAQGVPEGLAREAVNAFEDGDAAKFQSMLDGFEKEYGGRGAPPTAADDGRPGIRDWGTWEERGKTHQELSLDENERLRQVRDALEDAKTPEEKERLGDIYQGLISRDKEEREKALANWSTHRPAPPSSLAPEGTDVAAEVPMPPRVASPKHHPRPPRSNRRPALRRRATRRPTSRTTTGTWATSPRRRRRRSPRSRRRSTTPATAPTRSSGRSRSTSIGKTSTTTTIASARTTRS
jgi:hypothetical protein